MNNEPKQAPIDPFDVGQITERLPAWEMWEDGVEPEDEAPPKEHERAA
jgi:hypothetical protein